MTAENMTTEKRVWLRGKPVRGFFGGLLFGLGVALVAHAFKIVPFDDSMFTYFPLGSAVLFALRAHFGSAYRVEVGEGNAAAVEGPPPPPEPVAEA